MSKTIAIRVSDDAYSALEAQCLATGKTMTQLVTPIILGMIELPPAPLSPIEQRLAVLEDRALAIAKLGTQMSDVIDRLDAIDHNKQTIETLEPSAVMDRPIATPIALPDPTKEQLKPDITQQALFDIGLNPVEPVAIDHKISSESIRDSSEAGISTSEFAQYVESLLRAYSKGGYYFRFGDAVEPKLKTTIENQAKQLGFSSQPIKLGGKSVRVWLNREYCLQSVNS